MMTPEQLVRTARVQIHKKPLPANGDSPSAEILRFMDGVSSGAIKAVPWPWQKLHELTQALLPGTITVLCGDPGVGKTYLALDCIRRWTETGVASAAFFLEKDALFYSRRILAQLEGRSECKDLDWIEKNKEESREVFGRHKQMVDEIGGRITTNKPGQRATFRSLIEWMKLKLEEETRVLIIDPITAASAGENRWEADDQFMMDAQQLVTRYGASLILVTHPRKGNVTKKSGHDMAAGAAYFRFADTSIWIEKFKTRKRFDVWSSHGATTVDTDLIIQIHKARESKGTNRDIAMVFGDGLHFSEAGVILRESNDSPTPSNDEPDRPMSGDEMRRALTMLAQQYPGKLTTEHRNAFQSQCARFSFQRVCDGIRSMLFGTTGPDMPWLMKKLTEN